MPWAELNFVPWYFNMAAIVFPDPWFPDDINNGKTENLFFLLAGMMFLNFIGFLFVSRWYTYLKPPDERSGEGDDTQVKTSPDEDDDKDTLYYYDENNIVNTNL